QIGDINSSLESLLTMCIRLDSGKEKPKRNDNLTIGDTDKRAVSSEDYVVMKIREAAKNM
ncbi:MAG: hypothetical protein ACRC6D_00870, partial [Aeromonas sp.]